MRLDRHKEYISVTTASITQTVDIVNKVNVVPGVPGKFGILPPVSDKYPWDKETCLIVGDSLLNNIQEKKMGKKFKVRSFPGCVVKDLYFHITPLLLKKPSSIIIMAGTNDAIDKTSKDIFDHLMLLKKHIENEAPACRVLISCPLRFDYGYAQLTISNLVKIEKLE